MKIVVFGSGMYVTGRGSSATGTILSSVLQASINTSITEVHIISKSEKSREFTYKSAAESNRLLGTKVKVVFESSENKNDEWISAYVSENKFNTAIVCLPDHLHHEFASICLKNKLHTLVVKPLTPTVHEAKDLINLADSNHVYGAVEFHKRWDESNLYLKSSITEKRIGELLYFDINYSQKVDIPAVQFKSWASRTNIFQYLGIHYVDLIYFMTGAHPKKLSVYGTKKKLKSLGIDTYDSVHVSSIWGFDASNENDFYAHFNLNWIDPNETTAMSDQRISVVGTDGRIDCDQKNRGIYEVTSEHGAQSINPYFSSWIAKDSNTKQLNGYGFKSINSFITDVNALLSDAVSLDYLNENRPSFTDSLISTRFIEAVNSALDKNSNDYFTL